MLLIIAGEPDVVTGAVGSAEMVAWLSAESLLSTDLGWRRTTSTRHQSLRQLTLRTVRLRPPQLHFFIARRTRI